MRDLLEKLIQVDLSLRIGNLKNGVTDIKDHVWFDNISWTALINREVGQWINVISTRIKFKCLTSHLNSNITFTY